MGDEEPERAVAAAEPEAAVRAVYADGAARDLGLCCPATYDPRLLAAVPAEVLARDYGCGDPTRYVRPGETVLDLGSGSGKSVFLVSQVVGPAGRVIGVDMNDAMLALARRAAPAFVRAVGYDNVSFKKGRIQDLELDLELVDAELARRPPRSAEELARLEERLAELRRRAPLVADGAVDTVISDCVLNLVRPDDKPRLFHEIHRVLRRGGRAVISDIVSDEDVPLHLQRDPALWTGCISGAMREDRFLAAFEEAGLYGMTVLERAVRPWRVVEGIEFRSLTVAAYRGKEGPCRDRKQAVIYQGPFREVRDDDGHVLRRGARVAVCAKTFDLYSRPPYREHFELVEPRVPVPAGEERPFPCGAEMLVRAPRETKGEGYVETTEASPACAPGGGCC
ncbi:MAG TPA: methyltransferase domain-containing protein [Polyangia bacterium]|jgi:SAM-dependent methyltransferase